MVWYQVYGGKGLLIDHHHQIKSHPGLGLLSKYQKLYLGPWELIKSTHCSTGIGCLKCLHMGTDQ